MQSQLYQTPLRKLEASGQTTYVRAKFGLHFIHGNKAPYMTLSGEEYSKPRISDRNFVSCGQIRETLLAAFPELSPLAGWHLAADGEPMHYSANARYWWEIANFVKASSAYSAANEHEKAPGYFASTVALGTLPDDPQLSDVIGKPWPEIETMLSERLPRMREVFRALVEKLPAIADALEAEPVDD